jgi:hypothetical protein
MKPYYIFLLKIVIKGLRTNFVNKKNLATPFAILEGVRLGN